MSDDCSNSEARISIIERCKKTLSLLETQDRESRDALKEDIEFLEECVAPNVLNDHESSKELFFRSLDILSSGALKSFWTDINALDTFYGKFQARFVILMLRLATSNMYSIVFYDNDINDNKHGPAIQSLIDCLQSEFKVKEDGIDEPDRRNLMMSILNFFWILSDRPLCVPWLLEKNLTSLFLSTITTRKYDIDYVESMINILHNICRHDDGVEELNLFNALSTLNNLQLSPDADSNEQLKLILSMTIALISTPEQIKKNSYRMNQVLDKLLQNIIASSKEATHTWNNMHVSEALGVFAKLFVHDSNAEYVLDHAQTDPQMNSESIIALFVQLFSDFREGSGDQRQLDRFTCMVLLNILWSISFIDKYKSLLRKNKVLMALLEGIMVNDEEPIVGQYIPQSMETMKNSANGIMYNIKLQESNETQQEKQVEQKQKEIRAKSKPTVMISYSHADNSFCNHILGQFRKNENIFSVWIDQYNVGKGDDLWTKITQAIKEAHIFLCILSRNYYDSKSCRKEFSFAVKKDKKILPVYIDKPGECDWIDIHISELLYIRFPPNADEVNSLILSQVSESVLNQLSTSKEQQSESMQSKPSIVSTHESLGNRKPSEWTSMDIRQWLQKYKVPDFLIDIYDFQSVAEMRKYTEKLRLDENEEFMICQKRYVTKSDGDILEEYVFDRFKKALYEVPAETKKSTLLTSKRPEPVAAASVSRPARPPAAMMVPIERTSSTCTIL